MPDTESKNDLGVPAGAEALPTRHTPLPWRAEDTNSAKLSMVVVAADLNANGSAVIIGQCSGPDRAANTAFIVRACNGHHAMKEALEAALASLDEAAEHIGLVRMQRGFSVEPIRERARNAAEAARAALNQLAEI